MDISKLKKDCAVLAHNYQLPEVQDMADFVGDSLELCRKAVDMDQKYLLFCGVGFMAESAAMLNPDKTVLLPDMGARCPMAAMLPASKVRGAKERHPGAPVVLYINTWTEARAEADLICTSANAVEVVRALEEEKVLFGPDVNLAWHVKRFVPEKEIIPIPERGYCKVHEMFDRGHIEEGRKRHPEAEVLVHPECKPEVQLLADHVCSTGQMITRARESSAKEFLIATEIGHLHKLKRSVEGKSFFPVLENAICANMKKITKEKVIRELKERGHVVSLDAKLAERARKPLERMLELVP